MPERTLERRMHERRMHERRRLRLPVIAWEVTAAGKRSSKGLELFTKDVSEGGLGLGFESVKPYAIDAELWLDIHLPGRQEAVETKARVVHILTLIGESRYLIGLLFTDIRPKDREQLARCVDDYNIHKFLDEALKKEASDLHLTVGHPPFLRLKNHLAYIDAPAIKEGQIRAMVYPLLSPEQIAHYEAVKELNFAFSPTPVSRFRGNLHQQRGSLEATLRNLPSRIRRFEELGLDPVVLQDLAQKRSGLFLVAGHTGSGKTTTVAALIDYLNREHEKVIITIEDPIEYMFIGSKSIVKQRELGHDTRSYDEALKNAMRQDPDVIFVGEVLTPDTVRTALRAAETGHLVITTIHAGDSVQALERLVNVFDPQGAESVAQQVANALIGVLYQRLLPSVDGSLLLASELLLNTPAVRNQITERKFSQVTNSIVTGRELGMYSLQSSLDRLHKRGVISSEVYRENSAGL